MTYVREPGLEGAVATQEGSAEGKTLAELLDRARPPLSAALEIVAAAADVLTIAREDHAVHGDLRLQHIKIDGDGSVALEDFGSGRRAGRAPEDPATGASDVYALGVIVHSLLSRAPFGRLPSEPGPHDAAIDAKVAELDLGDVSQEPWVAHLRSFVALMLSHDASQRPEPDEVAEVLDHVAGLCPGSDLEVWARRVTTSLDGSSGSGRRRRRRQENLGSAKQLSRPLKRDRTQTFARRKDGADATVAFLRGRLPDDGPAPPPPVPIRAGAPAPTDWVQLQKPGAAAPPPTPPPATGASPPTPAAPAAEEEGGMTTVQIVLLGLAGVAALGLGIGLALVLGG